MSNFFGWRQCLDRLLKGAIVVLLIVVLGMGAPAQAASAIDPYVLRYLDVGEPVPLAMDGQGTVRSFSATDLSSGKRLFEESCKNCHVGGATLPDPLISLSLEALKGATPPRDNINSLVAYLRNPLSYDGSEESYSCRQVSEKWLPQAEVENLSAFILRAAQKAPGWGTTAF